MAKDALLKEKTFLWEVNLFLREVCITAYGFCGEFEVPNKLYPSVLIKFWLFKFIYLLCYTSCTVLSNTLKKYFFDWVLSWFRSRTVVTPLDSLVE